LAVAGTWQLVRDTTFHGVRRNRWNSREDGSFDEAWSRRAALRSPGVAYAWDFRPDAEREVGTHNWVSPDLVLVECVLATPTGHARLADPFVVRAGDHALVASFNRVEPITREDLQAYVERNRAEGHVQPEVQARYEDLVRALRAASR
jgi:hypothetical protein